MIFFLRLILSIILAFIICRFFFQNAPLINIIGFAMIMLGLAYLFEYNKRRAKGGEHGK